MRSALRVNPYEKHVFKVYLESKELGAETTRESRGPTSGVFRIALDRAAKGLRAPWCRAARGIKFVSCAGKKRWAPPSPQRAPARHHFRIKALNVRFCPDSDHRADVAGGPKSAQTDKQPSSAWWSLGKKGGRPLDQPVGSNDTYAVGDDHIEPVKCSLDEGGLR
jgi:hypothetical protein